MLSSIRSKDNGVAKYSLSKLETVCQRDIFWLLREMEDATRTKLLYNEDFIEEESYVKFSTWFNDQYDQKLPLIISHKRAYSTTHRIEIAYKSKYKCNACNTLLPPTFEIDHIVELRDGGQDEYDNLQALCPNCHSLKTRANTLKKNKIFEKEFGKRAMQMQENAFKKFECSRSNYFTHDNS